MIISQAENNVGRATIGSTWLGIDPSVGKLLAELMAPPFAQMISESVITGGQWHHVGLVYDRDGYAIH